MKFSLIARHLRALLSLLRVRREIDLEQFVREAEKKAYSGQNMEPNAGRKKKFSRIPKFTRG